MNTNLHEIFKIAKHVNIKIKTTNCCFTKNIRNTI
jgi:hypothetical protein